MLRSIILLYSFINVGDVEHGKVLINKLKEYNNTLYTISIDANLARDQLILEYTDALSKTTHCDSMLLAVGEKGLVALSELDATQKLNVEQIRIGASLHQYFDTLETLPSLNFLAIPEATIDTEEKKVVLKRIPNVTLTLAVPAANPTIEQLKASYDAWDTSEKPSIVDDAAYIIVMLPGDAPNQNGQMQYFSKKSAEKLFFSVVALREKHGNNHKVIVQNGPRTGKFNPQNGAISCDHSYIEGQDSSVAIDEISKYFVDLLKQESIPYNFFNFAFVINGNNKKALSVFNPLLYVAQAPNNNNFFVIPGESVSMLGQIPLYLHPEQVFVFKPDSMNESHEAILKIIQSRGHLSYFDEYNQPQIPIIPIKMIEDDITKITNSIVQIFSSASTLSCFETYKEQDRLEQLLTKCEVSSESELLKDSQSCLKAQYKPLL